MVVQVPVVGMPAAEAQAAGGAQHPGKLPGGGTGGDTSSVLAHVEVDQEFERAPGREGRESRATAG
jgi:hypothetical protein